LRRALQTAAPIAARSGLDPVVEDGLAEFDRGMLHTLWNQSADLITAHTDGQRKAPADGERHRTSGGVVVTETGVAMAELHPDSVPSRRLLAERLGAEAEPRRRVWPTSGDGLMVGEEFYAASR
jgi:hypothetical protein